MSEVTVRLTDKEMQLAADVAASLHNKIRQRGGKDAHGLKNATTAMESGGAQSELAAAHYYKVPWTAGNAESSYFGADIGTRTQVRSSQVPRRSHSLIIRQRDLDKYGNVPFVLVIQSLDTFRILGWCMAHEALTLGREWDGGDSSRPIALFVPQHKLHSPETLTGV